MILFGFYWKTSGEITIFCEFANDSYHRSLYTCKGTPSVNCGGDCHKINSIEGRHLYGKTNDDVEAFVMENKNITKIYKNLASMFPNLKFVNFKDNFITNITRFDTAQHRNLESLRLTNNKIGGIFEDIFEGLPLRHIELDNNNIEYVIHNLTYPSTLAHANFQNNKCIDMTASSPEAIDILKDKLLLRCSHSNRIKELEDDVASIEKHDVASDGRIASLENVMEKLKEAMNNKLF